MAEDIKREDAASEQAAAAQTSGTTEPGAPRRSGGAKKIVIRVLIALVALVVLAVGGIAFMFRGEIATIASIKKVNDYPFYTMTYAGDYGIDEFLEQGGASNDAELIEFVKTQGIKKVNPDEPNHMQSFISLVVVTDAADDEALKIARKARFRKNFKLGLNGWADLRVAILDLKSASVITNAMGKEMKKTLESNLQASLS